MTGHINIALVGSKFMGRAHSNAWSKVGRFFDLDVEPVMHTVVARDASEVAAFAQRWGWQASSTDWHSVVTADDIDLVDIGSPNHVHAEQAIAALEAGKHVACEKPLAGTLADAQTMAEAAAVAPGRTFVWFNYRRVPAMSLAHELIRNNALGRIYHVRAAYLQDWGGPETPLLWRFQRDIAGSGAHGDLNAHIIDAVRFMTGEEITAVDGAIEHTFIEERFELTEGVGNALGGAVGQTKLPSTVDDAVLFLARLSGGGIASFEATRLATGYPNANRIEIHGENGAIRIDMGRLNELGYYDAAADPKTQGWTTIDVTRGEHGHPYVDAWWPSGHGLGYEHTFINQASDTLSVLGGGVPRVPLPDFEDALRTQQVMHAAILAARERRPVSINEVGADTDRSRG
ncbi:MAG: gfo/Idh/MocA family oxidoreductase [Nitriliruptor sp.]|nr:MAG: gfo/Idh/MocA family oxidoreductase [Nitriliruptor sp.]